MSRSGKESTIYRSEAIHNIREYQRAETELADTLHTQFGHYRSFRTSTDAARRIRKEELPHIRTALKYRTTPFLWATHNRERDEIVLHVSLPPDQEEKLPLTQQLEIAMPEDLEQKSFGDIKSALAHLFADIANR